MMSGAGTSAITVYWGAAGSGNVSVVETTAGGCVGAAVNLPVTISSAFPVTSPIVGNVTACPNATLSYSVTNTANSTYDWNPSNGTVLSGAGTNSVTVKWGPNAGSTSLFVTETNAGGCMGSTVWTPVTIGNPPTGAIVGNSGVCAGATGIPYSVPNTSGSSYAWTITGGSVASGAGTNSITVNWGAASSGTVQVVETATGGCSGSPVAKSITMTPTTSAITGNSMSCANAPGIPYSVTPNFGSTYTWSITGGTQASGTNTSNITVNWGAAGTGTVSVVEIFSGGCNGASVSKSVAVGSPVTSSIVGPTSVCANSGSSGGAGPPPPAGAGPPPGAPASIYSVTSNMGSTYAWTITGGTVATGGGTNSITVNWGNAGNGSVSVTETFSGGCVGSPVSIPVVTINSLPAVSAPSSNLCWGTSMQVSPSSGGTWSFVTMFPGASISSSGLITLAPSGPALPAQMKFTQTSTGCWNYLQMLLANAPGVQTVSGNSNVSANTTGVAYSIPYTAGSTYAWTITGGSVASGAGTNAVTVNWGAGPSGSVSVKETNSGGCTGAASTKTVSMSCAQPVTSAITGSTAVCATASGVVYSVTNTSGSSYAWTITNGTVASGAGTSSITVNWGTSGSGTGAGNVSVVETNSSGCAGAAVSKTVNRSPSTTIVGSATVCANVSGINYSLGNQNTGSTYAWSATGGVVVPAANGVDSYITMNWGNAGSGNVSVVETTSTGCVGSPANFPVTITTGAPITSAITGPSSICATTQGMVYSVTNTPGHGYSWYVTDGFIVSGQNTNSITVNWANYINPSTPETVKVVESNSTCAGSPVVLNVNVNIPVTSTITQSYGSACVGSALTYSVTNTPGSTYAWSATGGTLSGSGSSVSVTWTTPGPGNVQVVETNSSGCVGFPKTYNVQVSSPPSSPSVITGPSTVCSGATGVSYSVVNPNANSYYSWTFPNGTWTSAIPGNSIITVNWDNNGAGQGGLKVVEVVQTSAGGGCSGPISNNFPVMLTAPTTSTITGNVNVCNNSTLPYSVTNTSGSTYAWTITGGTIASGAGTNSITVNWGAVGSGYVSVVETNSSGCVGHGVGTFINIGAPSSAGTVGNPFGWGTNVCENVTLDYYVSPVSGNSTYAWTVTNGTIVTNNGNVISVKWSGAGNGSIQMTETNYYGCQSTPVTNSYVVHSSPLLPVIVGNSSVCANASWNSSGIPYTVTSVTTSSSYVWNHTVGGAIQSNQIQPGTNPGVRFGWLNPGAENVTVYESNSWGCKSQVATLPVTANAVPSTSLITGSAQACSSNPNGFIYSVVNTPGSTYTWSAVNGTPSGSTTNSTKINWTSSPVSVQVIETNTEGCAGIPVTLGVSQSYINTGPITGSNSTWVNSTGVNYSVPNTTGSNYVWAITGGIQTSGGNTNSITVDWGPTSGTGARVQVGETNSLGCVGGPISIPVTLNITNPTISITSANTGTYGGTIALTTNTGGSPGAVTYSVTNGTGSATVTGSTLNLTGAGTVTVTASVAAAANYAAATTTQSITINKATPVVTITSGNSGTYNGYIQLSTNTGGSTGLVTYYPVNQTGSAWINGIYLQLNGAGTVQLTASVASDANYNAASSAPQTITIAKADQTITFNTYPATICAGGGGGLGANSTSNLPVTFSIDNTAIASVSGSYITSYWTGSLTATASQAGNANYNPAPTVSHSVNIIQCAAAMSMATVCDGSGGTMVNPSAMAISGNYAYVVTYPGGVSNSGEDALEVINLASSPSPTHVSTFTKTQSGGVLYEPRSIAVSGNYAYVAAWHSSALVVININNPASLSVKSVVYNGSGGASLSNPDFVFLSDHYVYVISSSTSTLEIIDIVDPANPTPTHKASITIPGAIKGYASGNNVYVTCRGSFTGMKVIDVTTPTSPAVVGSITDGAGGAVLYGANAISVSNGNAYIIARNLSTGLAVVEVVDVSTASAPFHKATLTHGTNGAVLNLPVDISISGTNAYVTNVASGGAANVEILDISVPASPTHVGNSSGGLISFPVSTTVVGNTAYVLNDYPTSTLSVLDVTNKTAPIQTSYYANAGALLDGPQAIALAGNYVYVASGFGNSVQAFDVTNPATPFTKANIFDGVNGAKLLSPTSIVVSGNYAYVASSGSNALEILNVANPSTSILHSGSISNGTGGALLNFPTSVFVPNNGFAYVASSGSNALEIINISTPTNPSHAGSIVNGAGGALLNGPKSVFVLGNLAYVVSSGNTLEIINVSNAATPFHVGSLVNGAGGALLSNPLSIYVDAAGHYAYIASNGSNALEVVDVSNPNNPIHAGSLTNGTSGAFLASPTSVVVSGNYAYVTAQNFTEIVDISVPTAPVHNGVEYLATAIAVSGNLAYTTTASKCLQISTVFPPIINSYTPSSGMAGTSVTITGANFSSTLANNTVKFNGVAATVTASTPTSITAIVPSGAKNGKIIVTVNGKTGTSAQVFQVIPTITFTSLSYGCNNGTVSLAVNKGGSAGALSFSVANETGTASLAANGVTLNLGQTGTVVVTANVAADPNNYAAGSAWQRITINPSSVAGNVSGAGHICYGSNTTLSLIGNTGAIQWQASTDNTNFSDIVGATSPSYTTANLTNTTYYRVRVTSGGCSSANSSSVSVTVDPTSVAGTISGAQPVCSGPNSRTLTVSGNIGVIQWQSSMDNSSFSDITGATSTSYTATNLAATTYYRVKVTSGVCSSATTASVSVIVNTTPSISISSSGSTTFCQGGSIILTANVAQPSGDVYSWSNGSTNSYIGVGSSGTYTVTVTNLVSNCYATASKSVTVYTNSGGVVITKTATCSDGSHPVTLSTSPIGTNYQWSTGATTSSISANVICDDTLFQVSFLINGSPASACLILPPCFYCRVAAGSETEETPEIQNEKPDVSELTVSPNPASDEAIVAMPSTSKDDRPVSVYDMFGKVVGSATIKKGEWKTVISTKDFANGLYIINVSYGDWINTTKMMVLHR